MQNILCGSRLTQLGRQLKQPHTHTRTHKCKHKHETPVDWRQLRVTVQAACQQSKEQNGFQVVREKGKQRL